MWEPIPSISRVRPIGVSARVMSHSVPGCPPRTPPEPPSASGRNEVAVAAVYKTSGGTFWHLATKSFTLGDSYVSTVCGRRLGRWNLMPSQPIAAVGAGEICAGCRRKADLQ